MSGMAANTYKTVTVAPDGSGEYRTLTAAAAAQARHCPVEFVLGPGLYYERPFLELDDYRITGTGIGKTILSAGVGGRDPWPGEEKTGTFRSWTLFLGGQSAHIAHLTVENTAGDGADAGQALAVYADAARVCMVDVEMLGNQDTLFTSPLPLSVREANGFRGPRENAPRLNTCQYYKNCRIAGNIDFIFGGANAVFDGCTIIPTAHRSGVSYITAACTPQGRPGYLFAGCTVQGNCAPGSVYLGRPWRANARVGWLDCVFSAEIHPAGWDNWNDPANEQTALFGECRCTGPGATPLRAFGRVNDPAQESTSRAMLAAFRADFAELTQG